MAILKEYPSWTQEALSGNLELRTYPNPVLGEMAVRVEKDEFGTDLREIGLQMIALMQKLKGVGLAANQVGLLKRICVVELESGPEVIVNPIVTPGRGVVVGQEGCLSIPGFYCHVSRHNNIALSYQTPMGKTRRMSLTDYRSRAVQHEVDHLNGKLFIDRLPKGDRDEVLRKLTARFGKKVA